KEITDARERRYRAHPEKPAPEGPQSFVEVKVTSIGELNELVECKRSGFKFVISEPPHVGGQNCAPSPLEFLLSGAVGCYAAGFAGRARWSAARGPGSGALTTASRRWRARSSTRAGI